MLLTLFCFSSFSQEGEETWDTLQVKANETIGFKDSTVTFDSDTTVLVKTKYKSKIWRSREQDDYGFDTIQIKANETLKYKDSTRTFSSDTVIIVPTEVKYKVKRYKWKTRVKKGAEYDTIFLINKNVLMINDSVISCEGDSICLVPKGEKYKIKRNENYTGTFKNDSTFYDSLNTKANGNWITKELFNSLVSYSAQEKESGSEFVKAEEVYKPFVGKIVGEIRFKQVDVLEGSVEDTSMHVHSFFGKISDGSHRNTRERVLMNYLLFDEGDTLTKYSLSDNERLLRQREFIRDVRIVPLYRVDDTSVVDLIVIVQDVYSTGIEGGISSLSQFNVKLFDKNLLGWGRALELDFTYVGSNSPAARYDFTYDANNLSGSYIDLKLNYFSDYKLKEYVVTAGRGFITPETKYAGGIGFVNSNRHVTYKVDSITTEPRTWEQNETDVWLGRSFLLGSKYDKNGLRKNIRIAARYTNFKSFERPDLVNDTVNFTYRNRGSLLTSIGFNKVNYYKERNILAYGVVEDMPYGIVGELIGGFEDGELGFKPYAGLAWGFGVASKRGGYLVFYTRQGGFVKEDNIKEGVVSSYFRYFTPLVKIGGFAFRPIVDIQFVQGLFPRQGTQTNFTNAVRGITADQMKGKSATSMKLELNIFASWNLYGFRTAIVPFLDLLAVTDESDLTVTGRREYAGYGLILRIRNENLIMNSLQIGVGYYPNPPDGFGNFKFGYSTDIPELFRVNRGVKPAIFPY